MGRKSLPYSPPQSITQCGAAKTERMVEKKKKGGTACEISDFQSRRKRYKNGGFRAILCQISTYKDMLDQVNEEIEANIQITREIESEIVKCSDVERALAAKESDLTKTLYFSHFELTGLLTVASKFSDYLICFPLSHQKKNNGLKNSRLAFVEGIRSANHRNVYETP
ncbi:hypothetical protein ACFX1W_039521 [Malus domestica]